MNEAIQLELTASGPPGPAPQAMASGGSPQDDVAWLEKLLFDRACWLTAAELLQAVGKPATDDNKRWIRDVASRADFVLSGPGSPGYKHMQHCQIEDITHYAKSLISQGKDMIRRGIRLVRNAHKLFKI